MKKHILSFLLFFSGLVMQAQNHQWSFSMGYIYDGDQGRSICIGASGNIYATGEFNGYIDCDPSAAVSNLLSGTGNAAFITKYTSSRQLVWGNRLTGSGSIYPRCIITGANEDIYITGEFTDSIDFDPSAGNHFLKSNGDFDFFIAKYDSAGKYVWAISVGGIGSEVGSSLVTDASGNIYVTGLFSTTADFDPSVNTANKTAIGNTDIYIASYTASGNYRWANGIGCAYAENWGRCITINSNNELTVTGNFAGIDDFDPSPAVATLTSDYIGSTLSYSDDIFLARYDSNGNYIWAKRIGGHDVDWGLSIASDAHENLLLTGRAYGLVDFDPSVKRDSTQMVVPGVFFAKYDKNGNFGWVKQITGNGPMNSYIITSDAMDNIYIAGNFNLGKDFDPSPNIANFVAAGNVNSFNLFIAKYDSAGSYKWVLNIGDVTNENCNSIAVDKDGSLYATGYFENYPDFDPSSGTAILSSKGNKDIFIAKYGVNKVGMALAKDNDDDISIYPNPSSGSVRLSSEIALDHVIAINIFGKEIPLEIKEHVLDTSILASGVYILQFTGADGKMMIKKFVRS
jgi:hypothetical protein